MLQNWCDNGENWLPLIIVYQNLIFFFNIFIKGSSKLRKLHKLHNFFSGFKFKIPLNIDLPVDK